MSGGIPALFDELGIGIALFDPEMGEIDSANSRLESLSGYPAAELRGMNYAEYSVAADGFTRAEAERRIQAAADGDTVFESGYITMDCGTGFGLAIVAEVAEAHGGSVTATESEGGGARFEFTGVEIGGET